MARERDEFKVGLTVLVVFALFIGVISFIGNFSSLFSRTQEIHVRFSHQDGVQGLRVKDPIRVGGVNEGRVQKIYLKSESPTPGAPPSVFVHVIGTVPAGLDLYQDCRVCVVANLLGEGGSLEILDTGGKGPKLGPGAIIDGSAPGGFAALQREFDEGNPNGVLSIVKQQLDVKNRDSLMAKILVSADDIAKITGQLRAEMNPDSQTALLAKLHGIMTDINDVTGALRRQFQAGDNATVLAKTQLALDYLDDSLKQVKELLASNGPKLDQAMTHVAKTAERLDVEISKSLAAELARSDPDSLLAKVRDAVDLATKGLQDLDAITASGRDLIVINKPTLQETIDNLAEASGHLKGALKDLRRNPWRLLYTPEKPEREYANLLETARAVVDAAGRLEQVNSRLGQLVEQYPKGLAADDPRILQIREEIKKAFCSFEEAQTKLWDLLKRQ